VGEGVHARSSARANENQLARAEGALRHPVAHPSPAQASQEIAA